jgi:hypothetical protein
VERRGRGGRERERERADVTPCIGARVPQDPGWPELGGGASPTRSDTYLVLPIWACLVLAGRRETRSDPNMSSTTASKEDTRLPERPLVAFCRRRRPYSHAASRLVHVHDRDMFLQVLYRFRDMLT